MMGQNQSRRIHQWVEERLSEYVDNRLLPRERAAIEQHLAECAACRASLESLRWTIALVKQAPAPALPRTFVLPVPAPRAPRPSLAFGLAQFGAALATVLLLVVIGVDVLIQSSALRAPMPSVAYESAAPPREIAAAPPTTTRETTSLREATRLPTLTATSQPVRTPQAVMPAAPLPTAPLKRAIADQTLSATPAPRAGVALATTPTATSTLTATATPVLLTATSTPTATATTMSPTATALPSPTLIAQARASTRAPQPAPLAGSVAPFDTNVLRALEVLLLALAVFFSAMVFVLWRARR